MLPGYALQEFVLVLQPHEELWNKIIKIKAEFANQYNHPSATKLKPHIALVNFTTWTMMEDRIIQRLQAMAMGTAPFKVELHDYSSYPSHTIFINVTTKLPIQDLVSQIKQVQRLLKTSNEIKPHFIEEPHIAIARKLKPWQYEQGWLEYSHRQFTGRFIANSFLLLKRPAGEKSGYQIVKRFEFMNLPVTTKQGCLFA
jgi:2'-5' RNA ligase